GACAFCPKCAPGHYVDRAGQRGTSSLVTPALPYPPSQFVLLSPHLKMPSAVQNSTGPDLPAQRCFRKKLAYFASFPPCTNSSTFFRSGELILEQNCTNVLRRFIGKGIACKQSRDCRLIFQQADHEIFEPWFLPPTTEGGEPHLPIQSRLMRCAPARRAIHIARFPFELVGNPIDSVRAAFDLNFRTLFCHDPEKSITIQDSEGLDARVDRHEWLWPLSFWF